MVILREWIIERRQITTTKEEITEFYLDVDIDVILEMWAILGI
jgi:hypothetical protein